MSARGRGALLVGSLFCTTLPAVADVDFQPEIAVGVSHTDNVRLAPTDELSETVYQVIPSFTLSRPGRRLSANAGYRGEIYRYQKLGDSEVYHQFNGDLSAALDPDNFFLRLGASRDRTIIDPESTITRSNLPVNTNAVDRDVVYFGPDFHYTIGSSVTARGDYRASRITYGEQSAHVGALRDYDDGKLDFSVDNYTKERGVTWAARYAATDTDYGSSVNYQYRRATVEFGAWAGQKARVFVAGGKESPWDMPFDPGLQDTFWEVGVATQASQKVRLEVAAGERSFGSSRRVKLDYTFEHGQTNLLYSEEPTSQGSYPYIDAGTLNTSNVTDDFLTSLASPEHFLSNRLQWNFRYGLRRTTFDFSAFDESREGRVRFDGLLLPNDEQKGASLSATRRAGARTEFVLSAQYISRGFGDGKTDEFKSVSFVVNRDIRSSKTRVSLEFSHSAEDSKGSGQAFDYDANLIALLLTHKIK